MRSVGSGIGIGRPARGVGSDAPMPLFEVRLEHRRDGSPLAELLRREGAEAQLVACRLTDRAPRRLVRWLDVTVPSERREHLLHTLRRRLPLRHTAVAPLGPGRLLLRVREAAPAVCVATYRSGGICVSCPLSARSDHGTWRVVLSRGNRANALLRSAPGGASARMAVARLRAYRSGSTLTRRQDRALRTAYELGYFGYPRRGSLGDVARSLGISRSAALELLRRATAKLAQGRYGDDLRLRGLP